MGVKSAAGIGESPQVGKRAVGGITHLDGHRDVLAIVLGEGDGAEGGIRDFVGDRVRCGVGDDGLIVDRGDGDIEGVHVSLRPARAAAAIVIGVDGEGDHAVVIRIGGLEREHVEGGVDGSRGAGEPGRRTDIGEAR